VLVTRLVFYSGEDYFGWSKSFFNSSTSLGRMS
jgi:hypothetical protein